MEHEQLVICSDPATGLRALIAIHNTKLGPALGGVRMWPYATENDALKDVFRLSRGMTYKAAVAGLNYGGGKAVIIGHPAEDKTELLFRAFGRFIEGLAGRYITAEDVGMEVRDMEWIRRETKYVTGISTELGGSGDPSEATALGVYMGMKASAKRIFGSDSLKNRKISVQGAGHVSTHLCRHLQKEGAELFISDIDTEKQQKLVHETGAVSVDVDQIYDLNVDIFSPCALGGILNDHTIPRLKCAIVAGAANNQLDDEWVHGSMLKNRGILYAPDYVINAGGVINLSGEREGYNREYAYEQVKRIYDTISGVFDFADELHVPTNVASNRMAELRFS